MGAETGWPWDLLEPLLRAGLRDLRRRASFDGAAVHLREGSSLVVAATDPPIRFGPRAARSPADRGPAGRTLASGDVLYLADLRAEADLLTPFDQAVTGGARTYLGVPLRARGSALGVLQMDSRRPDAFSQATRERLLEGVPTLEVAILGGLPHEGAGAADREIVGDILSVVSHELRGPVTSIRGLAETLAARAATGDPELVEELARRIAGASVRLHRLVGDLLDIARLGRGIPVRVEATEIEPVIRQAAGLPTSPPHEVTLEIEPGLPRVLADPDRLHQIMENLIGNAAKFSTPGFPIGIHARAEGERVAVTVEDHGEGIAPDMLERIFEPFARAPRGATDPGGLGLGLFLVQNLCRSMGADVEVQSTPGEGSRFTVRLAVAAGARSNDAAQERDGDRSDDAGDGTGPEDATRASEASSTDA